MPHLTLSLLGAFHAELDGQPVVGYKSNKVRALLAYLAVEADRPHRRETLAALLWPDALDTIALTNLRNALADLRQLLHDREAATPFVLINPDSIRLNPQADVWVDVWEFEQGIREKGVGGKGIKEPTHQSTIDSLKSAISLYQGEFLEGFSIPESAPFEEWVTMKREQFGQGSIRILRRLADFHEACGEYELARNFAQRQVELEPWLEEAYRQLMRIGAFSGQRSAALVQYETCKRLLADELGIEPAVETTRLYQVILEGREDEIRGAELLPSPGEPPFKGLQYFGEADAPLFFGRQALTARLVGQVRRMMGVVVGANRSDKLVGASRPTLQDTFGDSEGSPLPPGDSQDSPLPFLAVVGPSGCGKSSLVRAGLVPALKQDGWLVDVITPTAHPMEVLQESRTGERGAGHILIIDQFEELFTLCRSEEERTEFLGCLLTPPLAPPQPKIAVREGDAPLSIGGFPMGRGWGGVILTLRADFYGHCAQYPRLREALCARQEYIGPMTAKELRQAIELPALHNGWEFEPGLVDLILRDAGVKEGHSPEPGALPLLEHALLETWQRRRGRKLTLNGYVEAGGLHSAIAKTADSVFTQLSPEQQVLARRIFLRLTELGESTQDTRRRAPLSELASTVEASSEAAGLLKLLADARLITLSEENAEVAHEALIREWPALREWLREDREGLRLHRRLTEQAQAWVKGDRDPGDLYRGSRLLQAMDWVQQLEHARELNTLELEFLQASQELAAHETTEREQRIQGELEAARRLSETEHQRALALQSAYARELASQAELKLGSDPELSLLLALQAVSEAQLTGGPIPWEVQQALHESVADFRLLYTFSDTNESPWGVAYSPDNKQFAYYSNLYEAIIREAESGRFLHRFPNGCGWCGLAFSPDGKMIATGVNRNSVILWDAFTWQPLLTLTGPVKDSFALAFSPDGRLLAVGNAEDFTAAIWDLSSWLNAGSPPGVVLKDPMLTLEHYGGVGNFKGIRFSPDGRWVGTVFQNTAILWDALSGKELRTFTGHTSIVGDLSFSPDGSRLATTSWDGSTRVWDISTGRELLRVTGYGVAYSSDGSRLATSGPDCKLNVWDPQNGRMLFELPARGGVHDLVFSPDGLRLVSTHEDRYGRVWDASFLGRGELLVAPNRGVISTVVCSPDRSRIASVDGQVIRILRTDTFQELQVLEVFKPKSSDPEIIEGMAFSADNARLAVAKGKNGVTIWTLDNGQLQCQLPFSDSASAVAFSPAGCRLAVSGSGTSVVIYAVNENQTWREMERLEAPLTVNWPPLHFRLVFSRDGRLLAAGGSDDRGECGGHIFIWQVNDPFEETRLLHIGEADARDITALAFNPDSQVLASCGLEGLARLWDAATGKQLRQLAGHNSRVTDIHYSPDGKYLATASLDRTARVWDAADGKELLRYQLPDNVLGAYFTPDGQRVVVVPQTGGYHLNAFLDVDELAAAARARLTRDWRPEEIQKYLYGKKQAPLA